MTYIRSHVIADFNLGLFWFLESCFSSRAWSAPTTISLRKWTWRWMKQKWSHSTTSWSVQVFLKCLLNAIWSKNAMNYSYLLHFTTVNLIEVRHSIFFQVLYLVSLSLSFLRSSFVVCNRTLLIFHLIVDFILPFPFPTFLWIFFIG